VDPEWWTSDHVGRCESYCAHGLAVHICVSHCPVLAQCQEMAATNSKEWGGIVIGGLMWNPGKGQRVLRQPPRRTRCEACEPALVS
jgi:hypothetical protein